jgi:hypothetical protein
LMQTIYILSVAGNQPDPPLCTSAGSYESAETHSRSADDDREEQAGRQPSQARLIFSYVREVRWKLPPRKWISAVGTKS